MDHDRYYDRGTLRFSARGGQDHSASMPSHTAHSNYGVQYNSYTHSPVQHPQQQYHDGYSHHRPAQREGEWAHSSRSPPFALDAPGPSDRRPEHQATYRPRAEPSSKLPSHSDWLTLPSVSHALRLYGETRRQEPRFSLVIRQQPRRGLAIGNSQMSLRTARSVPIDPPPVCELLIDRSGDEQLLSLPEVFIRAQLVRGDSPMDECLPDARRIEPLVGDTLQSPFNSRIDTREDQSFFVFKELGVRNRGVYRLRFDLFDRVGLRIFKIASVYSDAFEVQERRKHPGLSASSALMDALVDRGMKYKPRKANDKQNPKKRKSPDDFYYGDERLASAARRQSYAAAEYDAGHYASSSRSPYAETQQQQSQQQQLIRPVPHRALSRERIGASASEERREFKEMLPPLSSHASQGFSAPRLSPPTRAAGDKPPQLPSLSRLAGGPQPSRSFPLPQLHLQQPSSSPLQPLPQLHSSSQRSPWSHDEERQHRDHTRNLSPLTDLERRPELEFRSSSSSVATSTSTGREASATSGFSSTPSSSTTEGTPFHFNPALTSKQDQDRATPSSAMGLGIGKLDVDNASAGASGHRGSISKFPSAWEASGNGADRQLAPLPSSMSSPSSSSSSSAATTARPTLPPISALYAASARVERRASAVATSHFVQDGYFPSARPNSTSPPPSSRSPPQFRP